MLGETPPDPIDPGVDVLLLGKPGEVNVVEQGDGYPGGRVPVQVGFIVVHLYGWCVAPVPEHTDPVGFYGSCHPRS